VSEPRNDAQPAWAGLVDAARTAWFWRGGQLVHQAARDRAVEADDDGLAARVRWLVVRNVYGNQNKARPVRAALGRVLARLDGAPDHWGLNLGAGFGRGHDRLLTIDVMNADNIDVVTDGSILPFRDDVFEVVIAQEVLEHIADFQKTIDEIRRVLRPGGVFYCQTPFQIGKHHGPMDYWRFSRDALEYLFDNDQWAMEEIEITLGHGSGFYRIAVEYAAVSASLISQRLYLPAKAAAAILFIPFRWLDALTHRSAERDRIAAGYLVVTRKRADAGGAASDGTRGG